MPASQTCIIEHDDTPLLVVSALPVDEREVYFSGDAPKFEIEVTNVSSRKIGFGNSGPSVLKFYLGYGSGVPEHRIVEEIEVQLEPDEGQVDIREFGMLPVQGNGALCLQSPGGEGQSIVDRDGQEGIQLSGSISGIYNVLHTFTIWDKNFYQLHYEEPKKLIRQSLYVSLGILLVAGLQVILILS